MPKLTVHETAEPWLEHRRQGVTSSDIPTLLGHGYAGNNIFNLYLKKLRAEPQDPAMRWRFRAGHHFEQLIAERVEEETGWSLWDPGDYAVVEHDEGLLLSTVDRLRMPSPRDTAWPLETEPARILPEALANLEFKTADRSARQGYQESKAFAYAMAQATAAMMCCNLQEGAVCTSFGLMDDFLIIPIVRSAALEAVIWERAREFWAYVEAREPPGPQFIDESREIGDALAEIYAEETGEVVELEEEWRPIVARLHELTGERGAPGEIEVLKDEKQALQNRLAHRMGEATIGVLPGYPRKVKYHLRRGGAESVDTRWEKRILSLVKA